MFPNILNRFAPLHERNNLSCPSLPKAGRERQNSRDNPPHPLREQKRLFAPALSLPSFYVTVFSDSRYVVDAVTKGWVFGWEKKGYKDKKNPDLWRRFMVLYRKHHVRFVWVKGHDGNPENERCDRLAVAAANSGDLKEDAGYTGKEER